MGWWRRDRDAQQEGARQHQHIAAARILEPAARATASDGAGVTLGVHP